MPADHAEVVGARYELTRELTRDSSFAVYEAEDHRLSAPAGIAWSLDPVGTGRGRRRALGPWLARTSHPHLVSPYDRGVDGARPFVAFHRPPSDLATELALAPFPAGRVAQMGADLSAALETLRRHRVPLGALHPGHVGIGADGSALLSPWTLAPPPTGWGGEAAWTPPEAVAGAASAATGDIWSLGAVLLSALIGAGPGQLSAADTGELVGRLRATADPVLLDAVGTSMAADPAQRFASGGDMAAALRRVPGVALASEAAAASRRWSRPGSVVARRATAFTSAAIVVILSATAAGMSLDSLGGGSMALSCAPGHSASGASCASRSSGSGSDRRGQRGTVTAAPPSSPPPTPAGSGEPGATALPAPTATVTSTSSSPSIAASAGSGAASPSTTTAAPPTVGTDSGVAVASVPVSAASTAPPAPASPAPSAPTNASPAPAPAAPTPVVDDDSPGDDRSPGHGRSSNGPRSSGPGPSSSTPGTGMGPGPSPYQSQAPAVPAGPDGTEGSGD